MTITVGVLALQGAFLEHLVLLKRAAESLRNSEEFAFIEVRNPEELAQCDSLIIPGGESTTISLVAAQSGILEPLRQFVKYVHYQSAADCLLMSAGLIASLLGVLVQG